MRTIVVLIHQRHLTSHRQFLPKNLLSRVRSIYGFLRLVRWKLLEKHTSFFLCWLLYMAWSHQHSTRKRKKHVKQQLIRPAGFSGNPSDHETSSKPVSLGEMLKDSFVLWDFDIQKNLYASASFERSETSSDTVMTSGWHSADVGGITDCQWWKYIEKSLKTLHWAKTQREHYFEHHCVRTKGNDKCSNVGHSMATEYRKIPSNPFLWWRWASAKLKKKLQESSRCTICFAHLGGAFTVVQLHPQLWRLHDLREVATTVEPHVQCQCHNVGNHTAPP